MVIKRVLILSTIFLTVAGVGALTINKAAPLLTERDLPGFFLQRSVSFQGLGSPISYLQFNESWATVPKKAIDNRIRRGGVLSYHVVYVDLCKFSTTREAQRFVDAQWAPNANTKGSPYKWLRNSPDKRRVGTRSWYAAVDPYDFPSQLGAPTQNLFDAAKLYNEDSLELLFMVGRAAVLFRARGTAGNPVNRSWALRIARVAAARVRHQNCGGSDDPDDDRYDHYDDCDDDDHGGNKRR